MAPGILALANPQRLRDDDSESEIGDALVRPKEERMPAAKKNTARMPPMWFVRLAWVTHRGLYRLSRGRFGLWRPKPDGWGALRLTTIGRRTGHERSVIVGYFEDGPRLVTMAMNGWGEGEPAWWLNLQANPDAQVQLRDGPLEVTARAAEGEERERHRRDGGRSTRTSTPTPLAARPRPRW